MRRRSITGTLLTFAFLIFGDLAQAGQTVLLSVKWPLLKNGEYIDKFQVDTWDVDILAVCKIPNKWIITAGTEYDLGGTLSGQSQGGIGNIWEADLGHLNNLFLIKIENYQKFPRGNPNTAFFPATFSGSVGVGMFGGNAGDKMQEITLKPEDFVWMSASRCPLPTQ